MFILDFLSEGLRSIALGLDSVAFSLLGSIYGLFSTIASLSLIDEKTVNSIINNMYVVVGIFAFFRIAVLLINAMITPDALAKQGAGLSKIAVNTVIMIVLLVFTPTLFELSRDVSKKIVDGHYVEKVFLNTDTNDANPSNAMERIAVGALITVNDQFLDTSEESKGKLVPNSDCTGDCEKAVYCLQDINGINYETDDNGDYVLDENGKKKKAFKGDCLDDNEGIIWSKLSDYNAVTKKKTYVYNYKYFILTIVGWVMAYVLLSFTFDVAKRMVELAILEILAPLFIATIVDPKSMQSGAFKKWLKTLGSSYVSLFIRQASVAIMLLCAKLLMAWTPTENANIGFFGKLIILLGVLIFVKGFPKWISNMVGLDGEAGLGGLSLKKKLASAALVGGAIQKASDSAKKYASQKGKNFAANRLRNTAARIGGSNQAIRENKENRSRIGKNGYTRDDYKRDRQSIFKQGKAAAKQSRSANWGKDAQGTIKDIAAGYMAGRLNVNSDAKGFGQRMQDKQAEKAKAYNQELGNTNKNIERAELAGKFKNASQMRVGKIYDDPANRDKKVNWQGYEEFKSAIGDRVMTEKEAYTRDLKNVAAKNGWSFDEKTGTAYNGTKQITWKEHKDTFSDAGQKDIAAFVAKNFQNSSEALKANVDLKLSNDQKIASYKAQIAGLTPGRDDSAITALNAQIAQLDMQNGQIKNANNSIIKDISTSEQDFVNDPQKCPSAVKVDDNTFVTAIGKYTRGSDGKFTYSVATDVSKNGFDPTSINAIMNKIAVIADKKDSDAKEAHKAMNPDKS